MDYSLLKLVHLGALVFWLGPPLGAWLVLRYMQNPGVCGSSTLLSVSKVFFGTLVIEHVAFVVLLSTGYLLASGFGFFGVEWLQQKLLIILVFLVPVEIADVIFGNILAAKAAQKLYSSDELTVTENWCLNFYHGTFTKLAIAVVPVSVVIIMYLAVSKVGFGNAS